MVPSNTAKALVPVVQKQTPPESWRPIIEAGDKKQIGAGTWPQQIPKKTPHDAEMVPTPQMGDGWCLHQPQYRPIFCWQFGVLGSPR